MIKHREDGVYHQDPEGAAFSWAGLIICGLAAIAAPAIIMLLWRAFL